MIIQNIRLVIVPVNGFIKHGNVEINISTRFAGLIISINGILKFILQYGKTYTNTAIVGENERRFHVKYHNTQSDTITLDYTKTRWYIINGNLYGNNGRNRIRIVVFHQIPQFKWKDDIYMVYNI